MKILNVGVVGTGFIGKQHIEAIRRIPGTRVMAVADSNLETAKRTAGELCIPKYYGSYQELLADPEISIVHNCTPSAMHLAVNRDAILAKKHIYSEKPLTLSAEESKELIALAGENEVAAGVNFNYRHNVMVKEMRQRVKNNIGKVFHLEVRYLQDWLMYPTDYDWRMDSKVGGVSRAVADIGSHCFDTVQYVLDQRIVSVYARLHTVFPVRQKCMSTGGTFGGKKGPVIEEVPVTSEDFAYILLRFEDGTTGIMHVSQVCAGRKNGLELLVSGSEYALEWKQERADRLWVGHRDIPNEELCADGKLLTDEVRKFATLPGGHAVAWHDALRNAIQVFYQSIRENDFKSTQQDYVTFETGHYLMKLIEACMKSDKTSQWVSVE